MANKISKQQVPMNKTRLNRIKASLITNRTNDLHYLQRLMCLHACSAEQSLFAEIKEEGLCKASSTSSGLQIAVFTQSV